MPLECPPTWVRPRVLHVPPRPEREQHALRETACRLAGPALQRPGLGRCAPTTAEDRPTRAAPPRARGTPAARPRQRIQRPPAGATPSASNRAGARGWRETPAPSGALQQPAAAGPGSNIRVDVAGIARPGFGRKVAPISVCGHAAPICLRSRSDLAELGSGPNSVRPTPSVVRPLPARY